MRIHTLFLQAPDLDAQRAFYVERLGFVALEETEEALTLRAGRSRVIFTRGPQSSPPHYHLAFNIPPEQFDEAHNWLEQRTALLCDSSGTDVFDFSRWSARALYFRDPVGNIVELIARAERGEDPCSPPRPFDAQCLLELSEIGLTAADVMGAAHWLTAHLGQGLYRDTRSEHFAAVGDAQGLLIIAQPDRVWFPETGVRSTYAPVKVMLEDPEGSLWVLEGPKLQLMCVTDQRAYAF